MVDEVGIKHDAGKLRYDLLPSEAIEQVVAVLTHGAEKYAPDNWRKVENPSDRYYAAGRRHDESRRQGEKFDADSNLPHLAHAICCLIFRLQLDIEREQKVKQFFDNAAVPEDWPAHLQKQAD